MIENIKSEIARELSDPHSAWTQTELLARLAFIEEYESYAQFLRSLDDLVVGVLPGGLDV